MKKMTIPLYIFRVYMEDTDTLGQVYYANYLKYAERARTEWLLAKGFSHQKLITDFHCGFVVKRCEVEYLKPARLEDQLMVHTELKEKGKTYLTLYQKILKEDEVLVTLLVQLVCVTIKGKICRLPIFIDF